MADLVTLFAPALRAGFHDRENLVTEIEEQALLGAIADSGAVALPSCDCGILNTEDAGPLKRDELLRRAGH